MFILRYLPNKCTSYLYFRNIKKEVASVQTEPFLIPDKNENNN